VLSLVGGFFLYLNYFVEKPVVEKFPDSVWELAFDRINDSWTRGVDIADENFLKNCPQFSSNKVIPRELRSCSASLFSCYYYKRQEKLSFKKNWFELVLEFNGTDKRRLKLFSPDEKASHHSKNLSLEVSVKLNNGNRSESKTIYLKDVCRQAVLPQGFYRYGTKSSKKLWHPSDIEYSIDRYLVRNIDIQEWSDQLNVLTKKEVIQLKKEDPYSAATSLTRQQMRQYCTFRGSEVLSSRVLDSITYHHGRAHLNEITQRPPGPNTSPYPFGARLMDSPHYYAIKKGASASDETCKKIFSEECTRLVKGNGLWGLGWSGVFEILGGPFEYLENIEMPRRNLKVSSIYFPLDSKVHQAGVRGFWNGQDYLKPNSFNFFRYSPKKSLDQYQVGFRCMTLRGEQR
jgi:hypothetical protein